MSDLSMVEQAVAAKKVQLSRQLEDDLENAVVAYRQRKAGRNQKKIQKTIKNCAPQVDGIQTQCTQTTFTCGVEI